MCHVSNISRSKLPNKTSSSLRRHSSRYFHGVVSFEVALCCNEVKCTCTTDVRSRLHIDGTKIIPGKKTMNWRHTFVGRTHLLFRQLAVKWERFGSFRFIILLGMDSNAVRFRTSKLEMVIFNFVVQKDVTDNKWYEWQDDSFGVLLISFYKENCYLHDF